MRLGWIMMKSIFLNLWIWSSRKHTQVHYAPTGRIAFLANGVTDIGPPRGPDCKRARPDLRLFAGARAKRTFVSGHIGFNLGQNPDSIGLLAPAGPNVGSTSKPTHNAGPIGA